MNLTFSVRDEFLRKPIAEKLIKLFSSDILISPAVIDGPWGSGKSEFCKKFEDLSNQQNSGIRCIYIDCYKYDHLEDPLMMLITSISKHVEDTDQRSSFIKASIPVAKVLSKTAAKVALSFVNINADIVSAEMEEAVKSGADELIDLGVKKVFDEFEKIDQNLKVFKDVLLQITSEKPIVILIDELDRCRPDFALSLLEKIKHVFDINGIKFLFTTNLTQLEAIVKKQYGSEIDAQKYLSKFFHFRVNLPDDHSNGHNIYNPNSYRYFQSLIRSENQGLKALFNGERGTSEAFRKMFRDSKLSLRDSERLCTNFRILNSLGGDLVIDEDAHWLAASWMAIGVFLHTFSPRLCNKILNGTVSFDEIVSVFNVDLSSVDASALYRDFKITLCAMFMMSYTPDEVHKRYGDKKFIELKEGITSYISKSSLHFYNSEKLSIVESTLRKLQFGNVN